VNIRRVLHKLGFYARHMRTKTISVYAKQNCNCKNQISVAKDVSMHILFKAFNSTESDLRNLNTTVISIYSYLTTMSNMRVPNLGYI